MKRFIIIDAEFALFTWFCCLLYFSTVFVFHVFFLLFLYLVCFFCCFCVFCIPSTVFVSYVFFLLFLYLFPFPWWPSSPPSVIRFGSPLTFSELEPQLPHFQRKNLSSLGFSLFFVFCPFHRIFVASSLCIFLTTGKTRDVPHYFLISPSFPFWKTSLILYYRIWISELRVCSSKYQNPSYFQGDSFLTISRRNTFPLLVPTETIRK